MNCDVYSYINQSMTCCIVHYVYLFPANVLFSNYTDLIIRFVHDNCRPQGMPLGAMPSELQSRILQLFNISLGDLSFL